MAVQNGAPFLERTLNTLPLPSVFAIDDHSTDQSTDLLERYGVPWRRNPGTGLASARNAALAQTKAPYLTFFDQDDRHLSPSIEVRLHYLESHPKEWAVAGRIHSIIDANDQILREGAPFECPARLCWSEIKQGHPLPGALWLYLFRREAFEKVGPFDPSAGALTDLDFLYRALQQFSIPVIDVPVAQYRVHDNNSTTFWERGIQTSAAVQATAALLKLRHGVELTSHV